VFADNRQEAVSVHVIVNNKTDQALIIGDHVTPGLRKAFIEAGISYVDRANKAAQHDVETSLRAMLNGQKVPFAEAILRDAFAYRNDVSEYDSRPLAELLLDKEIQPNFRKNVVKNKPAF
jgi:hypothetical protein